MNIIVWCSRYRNFARFSRMFILTMASALRDLLPAVILDQLQ